MSDNKNTILVALDGSPRGLKTIQYLCRFKPFLNKKLVLHNIITRVPECYYDLQKEPFSYKITSQVKAWEMGYKKQMEVFMERAKRNLVAAGFPPDAIRIVIADRKAGIARDIIEESKKGYLALMTRRRGGAKALLPLIMGSVSTKLVEKTTQLPVMVAGVQTVTHSLFIAVDGSNSARRAVEFTAEMVAGSGCRIVLCSVLRDFEIFDKKLVPSHDDPRITQAYEEMDQALKESAYIFEQNGIAPSQIETKIIQGAKSRAGSIVAAAKEEFCDTIVVGRKGRSEVSSFDIGRVPWKVLHGGRKMTVWIVP